MTRSHGRPNNCSPGNPRTPPRVAGGKLESSAVRSAKLSMRRKCYDKDTNDNTGAGSMRLQFRLWNAAVEQHNDGTAVRSHRI
jgi:hypothetical protein